MGYGQDTRAYNSPLVGQSSPASLVPEERTAIRDAITGGEQILSELQMVVDALEKRLDTVLLPTPPSTMGKDPGPPTPAASHVRGRLDIMNEGYQHATARIRLLMARIDV